MGRGHACWIMCRVRTTCEDGFSLTVQAISSNLNFEILDIRGKRSLQPAPIMDGLSALFSKIDRSLLFPLLILLLAAALWVHESSAQETDLNTEDDASQNWAQNWSQSWQERLRKRQSRFDRYLNWQLTDNTLLSLYGQVNFYYLNYDDGIDPFDAVRGNANSPSRVGLKLETDFENGTGLLFNVESGFRRSTYNGTNRGGGFNEGLADWDKTLLRKAEARLSVPSFGFLSLGQGSMAGDGITGFDFSNTAVIANNSVGDTIAGLPAYFATGVPSEVQLQGYFPTFDASRRLRVRYDSVASNGLSWAASAGREVLIDGDNNTYADAALRYETNWRGFRIKSGVAYMFNDRASNFLSGSVAGIDDETGLNFALAGGVNSNHGRYIYGKVGVIREIIGLGDTAVSADYYRSRKPVITANGSQSWGVSVVQNIDANQSQLYATYRRYQVDSVGVPIQDAYVVAVGVRFVW